MSVFPVGTAGGSTCGEPKNTSFSLLLQMHRPSTTQVPLAQVLASVQTLSLRLLQDGSLTNCSLFARCIASAK